MTDSEMLDWVQMYGSRLTQAIHEGYELEFFDKHGFIHTVNGLNLRDCIAGAILYLKEKGPKK